jgi:hypothetical protein
MLVSNREMLVSNSGSNARVSVGIVVRLFEEQTKSFKRVSRLSQRFVALASHPCSRRWITNLVRIATLGHERPCFIVRFRQEACDVPIGTAELEGLNDMRLNLWARVGLRKLGG